MTTGKTDKFCRFEVRMMEGKEGGNSHERNRWKEAQDHSLPSFRCTTKVTRTSGQAALLALSACNSVTIRANGSSFFGFSVKARRMLGITWLGGRGYGLAAQVSVSSLSGSQSREATATTFSTWLLHGHSTGMDIKLASSWADMRKNRNYVRYLSQADTTMMYLFIYFTYMIPTDIYFISSSICRP
ncbi:hypothetical protein F5144DRAFT_25003 [Chaetomium tenue]|uniref:Uncharacterized protein n=1 Tax=Chaetomium tenue TaxID=1854479 RepID=A0ACB7PNG4_9PEZI|nr:hypothetical protein F5144DRAFT_25003 [Chaetomium globosum]